MRACSDTWYGHKDDFKMWLKHNCTRIPYIKYHYCCIKDKKGHILGLHVKEQMIMFDWQLRNSFKKMNTFFQGVNPSDINLCIITLWAIRSDRKLKSLGEAISVYHLCTIHVYRQPKGSHAVKRTILMLYRP